MFVFAVSILAVTGSLVSDLKGNTKSEKKSDIKIKEIQKLG